MALAIGEAEQVLHGMLRRSGLDPSSPQSVGRTWEVFREFVGIASEATDIEADGVLYQVGTFSFDGPEEFYLDFTRQFEVLDEDGEHDHHEQLQCAFRFPLTEATRKFEQFDAWWFASSDEPWSGFAAMVERRPEFVALRATPPHASRVEQEEV